MKVDVTREPRGFHYKLTLDEDDHKESWRSLKDVKAKKLQLVGDEYRVELPEVFTHVHPDLHATAIAFALWPFLGSRLTLPFGVSSLYARLMEARHGVRVTNVDPVLTPRRAPEGWRPCLLFSGGADSVAASMVMPPDTVTLFYDRIVHRELAPSWERNLADQAPNRAVCDDIRALGRELHIVRDDHEALWRPYPGWHDEMSVMPVLYLADSLKLAVYESGNTLSVFAFGGYHVEDEPQWAFQKWDGAANPEEALSVPVVEDEVETLAPDDRPATIRFSGVLEAMGLTPGSCLAGLTEVATTILVARSPMRNKAFSCYYQPDPEAEGRYCLRCDKCFNKLLMLYIVEDREVPAELFESFLRHRHLAEILARPIYDWHHLWYYTFQKLRCSHPVAQRLHESALQGPDLSVLEKWYIPVRRALPGRYLAHVSAAIEEHVEPMSESDIQVLESMHVPPLVVPEELRPYLEEGDEPMESDVVADIEERLPLQERPGTLVVRFRDKQKKRSEIVMYVGRVEEGDNWFKRHGNTVLAYAPTSNDTFFALCVEALESALSAFDTAPNEDNAEDWEQAIERAIARTVLPLRFEHTISPVSPDEDGDSDLDRLLDDILSD